MNKKQREHALEVTKECMAQLRGCSKDLITFGNADEHPNIDIIVKHSSQWIPVEERLPELNVPVLVYDESEGKVEKLHYTNEGYWEDDECLRLYGVTHWMPLPPIPGGEDD